MLIGHFPTAQYNQDFWKNEPAAFCGFCSFLRATPQLCVNSRFVSFQILTLTPDLTSGDDGRQRRPEVDSS